MAALFDSQVEDAVRQSFAMARKDEHDLYAEDYDLAIEYEEGEMLRDVEHRLAELYPRAQKGAGQNKIQPLVLPLVKRYLDEVATAYTGQVHRSIIDENGKEDESLTAEFNDALEEIGYNQTCSKMERLATLLLSCGIDYRIENGQLDPVIIFPQDIIPLAPQDRAFNSANQDSYNGFIMDLRLHQYSSDYHAIAKRTYALQKPEGTVIYTAKDPDHPETIISEMKNPFTWPQQTVKANGQPGGIKDMPLQMLTIWHDSKPVKQLIPMVNPSMLVNNRMLNVMWSFLMDIMRFQGGATPVRGSMNPHTIERETPIGVRFPVVFQDGGAESFSYAVAGNDYAGMVEMLHQFNQLVALAHRMAPGDFSTDAAVAQSGFAKLIENLPKTEARKERVQQLIAGERRAFPRLASALIWLGKLSPKARGKFLQVEFSSVDVPRSVDEETRQDEHDFKWGLSTPAHKLAQSIGVSVDEAQERIKANRDLMRELKQEAPSEEEQQPEAEKEPPIDGIVKILEALKSGKMPKAMAVRLLSVTLEADEGAVESMLGDFAEQPEQPGGSPTSPPQDGAAPRIRRPSLLDRLSSNVSQQGEDTQES